MILVQQNIRMEHYTETTEHKYYVTKEQETKSTHKGYKERYLLWQKTTFQFSGELLFSSYKTTLKDQLNVGNEM